MELQEIRKKIKKELDKNRYEHTKGVMYTAGCLAMAHNYSVEDAMLAGLLHDCAKCIPNDEKLRLCKKNNILITAVENDNPTLLHAKLGAFFAEELYGVSNPEILHAIRVHTTGEPDMNLLDKILYIADYIEPYRDKAPNLELVRRLAFRDLDVCMAKILHDMLPYLAAKGDGIDPMTKMAYDFYKNNWQEEKENDYEYSRIM